jgi:hypothetical protein
MDFNSVFESSGQTGIAAANGGFQVPCQVRVSKAN